MATTTTSTVRIFPDHDDVSERQSILKLLRHANELGLAGQRLTTVSSTTPAVVCAEDWVFESEAQPRKRVVG